MRLRSQRVRLPKHLVELQSSKNSMQWQRHTMSLRHWENNLFFQQYTEVSLCLRCLRDKDYILFQLKLTPCIGEGRRRWYLRGTEIYNGLPPPLWDYKQNDKQVKFSLWDSFSLLSAPVHNVLKGRVCVLLFSHSGGLFSSSGPPAAGSCRNPQLPAGTLLGIGTDWLSSRWGESLKQIALYYRLTSGYVSI